MHQRDYILRIIEQLGSVLAELRRRILGRQANPAAIERDLAGLAGESGMDLELLRRFSPDTLRMFVAPSGEVEPARCWITAELLYLDGLLARAESREEDALASLTKARLLFTLIEPGGGMLLGFPEAASRIEEIDAIPDSAGSLPADREDGS